MKVDLYQNCPCGSGKKIKFCCKDLARDIESLMTKIEGQQVASAQAQLAKLMQTHPDRECLLAIQGTLSLQIGDVDATQATLDRFLNVAPENPIALALLATIKASSPPEETEDEDVLASYALSQEATDAVAALQQSLENCGDAIPLQLYDAVGAVGQRLLIEGQVIGAREHFVFQAALSPDESTEAVNHVMSIDGSTEIPLLLKQDLLLHSPPEEESAWKSDYAGVYELGQRGQWGKALEQLDQQVERYPDVAFLRRAQGVLACRLGNANLAVEAWRAYAHGDGVDHEEAVEAAALAQVLSPSKDENPVDLIELTLALKDAESTLEKLQSDKRCVPLGLDVSRMGGDGPPPKAGFGVLDREMPEEIVEETNPADLPQLIAQVLVYGKETDQPARLVLPTYRGELAEDTVTLLKDITGETLDETVSEKVLGSTTRAALHTRFQAQLPANANPSVRSRVLRKAHSYVVLNRWPDAPHNDLDGKTPREALDDADLRIELEATVLALETSDTARESNEDFVELRKVLGLPEPQAPAAEQLRRVPVVRLFRVNAKALSDSELATVFAITMQKAVPALIVRFARELLGRDSAKLGLRRDELYGFLARYVEDPDEALSLIHNAQHAAMKRGESPAIWKINELGMRLARQEVSEFQTLLANIHTNHMKDPGIPELLAQQLVRFGILRPDGRAPARGAAQPAPAEPPAVVGVAPSGPEPTAPTLASEQSAGSEPPGEGKSKLWLPGME